MAKKLIFSLLISVYGGFLVGFDGSRNSNRDRSPDIRHEYLRIEVTEERGPLETISWRQRYLTKQNLSRVIWFATGGVMVGSLVMATMTCSSMESACNGARNDLGQCTILLNEIGRIGALVCKLDPSLCD